VRGAGGLNYYSVCPNSPGFFDREKTAIQKILEYLRDNDTKRTVIAIEIDSEIGSYLGAAIPQPWDPNLANANNEGHRCMCTHCAPKWAQYTDYPTSGERSSKFMAQQYANYYKGLYDTVKQIYPIPAYCNQINQRCWPGWRYEEDPSIFLKTIDSIDFAGPTVMFTQEIQWLIDDLNVFLNLSGVPAGRNISFVAEADTGYQPNIEAVFWYPVYWFCGIGGLLWDSPFYSGGEAPFPNWRQSVNSIIVNPTYQSKLRGYNGPYKAMMSQVTKYAYPGSGYSAWWGYQTNVGGTVNGIQWWASNTYNRRGGIIAAEPQDLTVAGWTYTFDMVAGWLNTAELQVERGHWDGFIWNGAQTQAYTKPTTTKLTTTFNGGENCVWTNAAIRVFTSKTPSFTSTITTDPDTVYYKNETITLITTWDSSAYRVTADFSQVDSNYTANNVTVIPLGDKKYKIVYAISSNNTVANGTKTVPVTANNYSISGGAKLSTNNSFTITYKTQPATISCSANPTSIMADGTATSDITATVRDSNNNIVTLTTDQVTFTISGAGGTVVTWLDGSVSPRIIPCSNGIATTRMKSTTLPGTITVTATFTGVTPANATITAIAGTPVKVLSNVNPATMIANGLTTSTITASLVDSNNNVILSATNTIIYSISGQGTWADSGTTETRNITPNSGTVSTAVKSTVSAGLIKINCNSYGLEGSTVTVTTTHGPAYKIKRK
jgi:hypothetical protein